MTVGSDTEARLLDAAAELFATRGYQSASLRAIATRAGLTTGAIYSRFPGGKPDLLLRLAAGYPGGRRQRAEDRRGATVAFLAALLAADHDPAVANLLRAQLPSSRTERTELAARLGASCLALLNKR